MTLHRKRRAARCDSRSAGVSARRGVSRATSLITSSGLDRGPPADLHEQECIETSSERLPAGGPVAAQVPAEPCHGSDRLFSGCQWLGELQFVDEQSQLHI